MSELKSNGWSSVVVGKWNPAILSPKGIATHIFKNEPDEPLEVMVPLDAQGAPLVVIEGLRVMVNFDRLAVDCEDSNWGSLEKARKYCCNAIDALPITPFTAAGFNVRYELKEPEPEFIDSLVLPIDGRISEQHLTIEGRETVRSIIWGDGVINLNINRVEADIYNIMLNFDKKSANKEELKDWLSVQTDNIKDIVTTILCTIIGACEEGDI